MGLGQASRALIGVAVLVATAALGRQGHLAWTRWLSTTLPPVQTVDVYHLFIDDRRIRITIRGTIAPWDTTAAELRTSTQLWRRMHLADWNSVPEPQRSDGLDAILREYRPLLMRPAAWDRMSVSGWDEVPQPVRTLAYRQMVSYWAGFYDVGGRFGLDPVDVRDTLAAIVMSESWFDHRALSVSRDGNRDFGLAQASTYARSRFRTLHDRGIVDVAYTDAEFFNPWKATRFLAVWFNLLLDESAGDLDLSVRAYHRGTSNASDRAGAVYLQTVQRRLHRFIRNHEAPPAWDYFWRRGRSIEKEEWPWVASLDAATRRAREQPTK